MLFFSSVTDRGVDAQQKFRLQENVTHGRDAGNGLTFLGTPQA